MGNDTTAQCEMCETGSVRAMGEVSEVWELFLTKQVLCNVQRAACRVQHSAICNECSWWFLNGPTGRDVAL